MRRLAVMVVAFGALAGCERGCLSTWLRDHGVGGAMPGGSPARTDAAAPFELSGTDCSDGLARCRGGVVETSVAAHVPASCASTTRSPESRGGSCACPWVTAGRCGAGCVVEGVEVAAEPDVAPAQLCRPLQPVARPVAPSDAAPAGVCAEAGVACVDGVVRICDGAGEPIQPVATCLHGCEPRVGALDAEPGPSWTRDGTAAILCRRAHAERR